MSNPQEAFHKSVTITAEAAGNYAANDVISNDATNTEGVASTFSDIARQQGRGGVITQAIVTCSVEALVPRLRLWLFNANPTASELDDNAAFSIAVADRTKVIGYIDFPALSDQGAVSAAFADGLSLTFTTLATSRDIYGVCQTLDAETNESAGMTVTFDLFGLLD